MTESIVSTPLCHGIDVSRYDERVDWSVLAAGGVSFAIAKATQGDYNRDPLLERHLTGAANAGLFAVSMIARDNPEVAQKLAKFRQDLTETVLAMQLPES